MDPKTERLHLFMEKFMKLKVVIRRSQKHGKGGPKHLLVAIHSIGEGKPIMGSTLASKMEISNAAASQLIDKLVELDWVKRQSDDQDRRITWIELTPNGNAVLMEHFKHMSMIVEGMLEYLGEEDAKHIDRILDKLVDYAMKVSEQDGLL